MKTVTILFNNYKLLSEEDKKEFGRLLNNYNVELSRKGFEELKNSYYRDEKGRLLIKK